jgi:hypothetical protein
MPADTDTQKVEATLREHAMSYPGAHEDFPWGHRAIKVKDKTFLFMSVDGVKLSLSTKLPESGEAALTLPFTQPTEYGLGKSGWVTARFESAEQIPVPVLKAWINESYHAIAPKRMSAQTAAEGAVGTMKDVAKKAIAQVKQAAHDAVEKVKTATKKPVAKKAAAKKPAVAKKPVAKKAAAKKPVAKMPVAKKAAAKKPVAKKVAAKKPAAKKAAPTSGKRQTATAAKRARRA